MYGSFFDGLFDGLTSSWNRAFKEKDGYTVIPEKNGKGFLVVFNTLGISESDIKVTHSKMSSTKYAAAYDANCTYLHVIGASKIPELNDQVYSVNYELVIRNTNPIDSVQYKVKDGLTIVYVKTKDPEPDESSKIAKNIASGEDFAW